MVKLQPIKWLVLNLNIRQVTSAKHLASLLFLAQFKVANGMHAPSHCWTCLKLRMAFLDKNFGGVISIENLISDFLVRNQVIFPG